MDTILVTGAGGTIGNYVIGIAEAAGYRVIASDETAQGVRVPVRGEVRALNLTTSTDLKSLVEGCDGVIHTAAQLSADAAPGELSRMNTDVVARLFEAAETAGVRRFVHVSTAMLYAPGQAGSLHEEAELGPRGPHGLSKHGAEMFLRARSKGGLPWTVVRAAPVYGRRGRHFAASLLSFGPVLGLMSPILPRLRGGPLGTMVHAEDVARALVFLLKREDARFEVFNVADGDVIALGDRITETLDAYGLRTAPVGVAPIRFLSWIAKLSERSAVYQAGDTAALALWRLVVARHGLKPALRPRLDAEALTLLHDDLVVDSSKLLKLGWHPRFPRFAEGFRQVLRWYQAERWVPRY